MINKFALSILLLITLLFSNEAFAQAKASPAVKAEEEKKAVPPAQPVKQWSYGSLMFDKKTTGWIKEALKSYEKQIPIEILLPSLFPSQGSAIVEEHKGDEKKKDDLSKQASTKEDIIKAAPVFFLKSILYFAPDNWSLWLNDKKITNKADKTFENIAVMDISRSQVMLVWKRSQIDIIYPGWKNNFIAMEGNKYDSPEKNIVVDAATGNISFILKPNQSLVSRSLEIVEGSIIKFTEAKVVRRITTIKFEEQLLKHME